jgi:hypothetical protein
MTPQGAALSSKLADKSNYVLTAFIMLILVFFVALASGNLAGQPRRDRQLRHR